MEWRSGALAPGVLAKCTDGSEALRKPSSFDRTTAATTERVDGPHARRRDRYGEVEADLVAAFAKLRLSAVAFIGTVEPRNDVPATAITDMIGVACYGLIVRGILWAAVGVGSLGCGSTGPCGVPLPVEARAHQGSLQRSRTDLMSRGYAI